MVRLRVMYYQVAYEPKKVEKRCFRVLGIVKGRFLKFHLFQFERVTFDSDAELLRNRCFIIERFDGTVKFLISDSFRDRFAMNHYTENTSKIFFIYLHIRIPLRKNLY